MSTTIVRDSLLIGVLALLLSVLALPFKSAAQTTTSATSTSTNSSCRVIVHTLSRGSSQTQEIRVLQRFLSDQGYFRMSIVGRFGPQTHEAVRNFQAAHGITPTGVVGPLTRSLIERIGCTDNFNFDMGTSTSVVLDTTQVALDRSMRALWEDHVSWTRLYIVESAANLPGASTTAARLLKNQEEIGNAMKPYYGAVAGDQLTSLLKQHIQGAVDVINAAKGTSTQALNTARTSWTTNADAIAAYLHQLNPNNWPQATLETRMHEHLNMTLDEATAQLQGNYATSIDAYDRAHMHIRNFADFLTRGIIAQFPGQF